MPADVKAEMEVSESERNSVCILGAKPTRKRKAKATEEEEERTAARRARPRVEEEESREAVQNLGRGMRVSQGAAGSSGVTAPAGACMDCSED